MAQTTVYTCDICKQSKSNDDLLKIKVTAGTYRGVRIAGFTGATTLEVDICKECLKKKGFVVESKKEEEEQDAKKNQKTLEDKLYDILEDMGVAFQE
ncbi:hypothetical protein C8E03_108116 [Lachnotalea glycerini]|uniref:Uncharacterized protein n=1 Tax=Lachnotalea glycerini TaxID=1763509 RepID=A0A318EPG2_9FIRM|nr:hypothetical protein [Lachnotalea glycerini]PXV88389.1 hypothetical protein C8E03_108116 [Lachnotalea glycerini]